ncbi:MAG TPA: DUF1573 domain-containing protein [Leeuwenhoekiella sp.]|nr:DUF1573 domain-containing protein [Leeuwenhoekiella sp.]
MKKYMILLFMSVFALTSNAQEKKAEINFETDVIDYGEIAHGADGLREFKFTNTGNAPLVINKAYSTCGCTVPTPPKDPIMPGDTGVIKVKYNTNLAGGPIRKTITVYTNASKEPYTLKIKGTLLPEKGALEKEQSGPINN